MGGSAGLHTLQGLQGVLLPFGTELINSGEAPCQSCKMTMCFAGGSRRLYHEPLFRSELQVKCPEQGHTDSVAEVGAGASFHGRIPL